MTTPAKPITFTLSIRGTALLTECRVYENRTQMRLAAKKFVRGMYSNVTRDTMAYCEGTPSLLPKNRLAVIFLNRRDMTLGMVAHELDHAANCLMARRGMRLLPISIDEATPEEEMHCSILEDLLNAFHSKYRV